LSSAFAFEALQAIARRYAKIGNGPGRMQQTQFAKGDSLNITGQFVATPSLPDPLGFTICKALDHARTITQRVT